MESAGPQGRQPSIYDRQHNGVVEAKVTWERQMAGFRDKVALREEGAG